MIHEAVGHGLEADLAMEGLVLLQRDARAGDSRTPHRRGGRQDAPFQRGTYAFDDEGTPSQRTVLVEKGVLKNYLFDRFHAMKYDMQSTANGRRESFRYRPIPA